MNNEKKYVLIRMKKDGNIFQLDRKRWDEFQKKHFYRGAYEAEVIAESDDAEEITRFRLLARED